MAANSITVKRQFCRTTLSRLLIIAALAVGVLSSPALPQSGDDYRRKMEEARKEQEAKRQAERDRQSAGRKQGETQTPAGVRKQEEERKRAEELRRQEEARKQEDARRREEAVKREDARRQEEAKKRADEAKRQEEAKKLEDAKRLEEAAKKQAEAQTPEETKATRRAEAVKEEEAQRQAEAQKRAEEAKREKAEGKKTPEPVDPQTQSLRAERALKALKDIIAGYLGIPYLYGGTTRSGLDCSGFAGTIYRDAYGTALPRTSKDMWAAGKKIDISAARPGDLVFFKSTGILGTINHVGIYMGNNQFAHSSTSKGVGYDDLDNSYYKKHFAGVRRMR